MPIAEGPVQPSSQNVINLMDALRRSMELERGGGRQAAATARSEQAGQALVECARSNRHLTNRTLARAHSERHGRT